ncbi:MAG: EthD family reductase [Acidobacteriia bacterium]|nr:EthD family reductase [Terriglobia bacterium]
MIKVSVLYPNTAGSRFDMDYYLNKHIPMVRGKVGPALKGVAVDQGLGSVPPGTPPIYLATAHLLFESMEAFGAAFGPHAPAIMGDVPNYTNTQPVIQIGEVKISG